MAAGEKIVIIDPVTGDPARVIAGVLQTSGGGGGGTVTSVTAGDASIVVTGTAAAPILETGDLDDIATLHPPNAPVPFNAQKLTGVLDGTAAQDAVTVFQTLKKSPLVATAIKTAATYNAAAGDFVPTDTTANAIAVTLPTTPADRTIISVKMIVKGGTNLTTVAAGGAAAFNRVGGATTATLNLASQGFIFQYNTALDVWYVIADDLPLSGLDLRYAAYGLGPVSRASNTILAVADYGRTILATAAFTQTLTAAATLGAGWWCIIKNDTQDGTTVLVVDPNGAETIDSLATITMYSGAARLITCDGSNFRSVLIEGGFAKFTPGVGSFVIPSGISQARVVVIGGGGQGGGGASAVSTAKSGGAGGGGGAVAVADFRPADLGAAGASITVTVGAGGTGSGGGGAAGAGADGSAGADGAQTTFGTLLKAGGGGGGAGGAVAGAIGGGGGGTATSGAGNAQGTPGVANANGVGGQGVTRTTVSTSFSGEWGGGGGGAASNSAGFTGGSSVFAGAGGGGGGWVSGTNVGGNALQGGKTQTYTAGTGASGGTAGAPGNPGNPGTFVGPYCGGAGGGGGGGTAAAGGIGGAGSIGSGGGGGGASSSASSSAAGGAGGAGGAGECRVYYS